MKAAILVLVGCAIFAVALRTVGVRTEVVRAGYERARLEQSLREERERIQSLEAEVAAAGSPATLLAVAARLGVGLVERAPEQIVVASPPAYVERREALARR